MQGYILKTKPVRDEDLLVWILGKERVFEAYRFYGARHASITQGFKLDFELDQKAGFLPHLKGTMHLGARWLLDKDRLKVWQNFMGLLYEHLRHSSECEGFYYELLEELTLRFERQNPKRAVLEGYLRLLSFEGRLQKSAHCFLCEREIKDDFCALSRSFLLAHHSCLPKNSFEKNELLEAFDTKSLIHLSDEVITELYFILLEGI